MIFTICPESSTSQDLAYFTRVSLSPLTLTRLSFQKFICGAERPSLSGLHKINRCTVWLRGKKFFRRYKTSQLIPTVSRDTFCWLLAGITNFLGYCSRPEAVQLNHLEWSGRIRSMLIRQSVNSGTPIYFFVKLCFCFKRTIKRPYYKITRLNPTNKKVRKFLEFQPNFWFSENSSQLFNLCSYQKVLDFFESGQLAAPKQWPNFLDFLLVGLSPGFCSGS